MVDISISVRNFVDQPSKMAFPVNSNDACSKPKQNNHTCKNKRVPDSQNCLKIPACDRSRSAAIDVVILIAVVSACGFLFVPYIKICFQTSVEFFGEFWYLVREEVSQAPVIYAALGVSLLCAAMAGLGILMCIGNRCGKPNCQGLRKAAEFDIQLETEECVKSSSPLVKDGVNNGGHFELPRDYHRELESELKKIAPPNGRAVLVFRARCGCSVGRFEVPGPKKQRKVKK